MKNNKSIFIFFIFTILHLNFAYSQDFEKKPTWEENFKKLRSNTWNNGANVNGGQCYTNFDPQTTYVKKGKLHLKAKEATKKDGTLAKTSFSSPKYHPWCRFTWNPGGLPFLLYKLYRHFLMKL